MPHLILELILWVLLAFFVGCIIGCILRKLFAADELTPSSGLSAPPAKPEPAVEKPQAEAVIAAPVVAETVAKTVAEPAPLTGKPARPKGIAAAREAKPDNLQRISGIGPKNEKTLHGLGFFHFDQIAAWTGDEIQWVDEHLKFNGRIIREKWVHQAQLLSDGKEDEFRRLYGSGGVKNQDGTSTSGSETRKS